MNDGLRERKGILDHGASCDLRLEPILLEENKGGDGRITLPLITRPSLGLGPTKSLLASGFPGSEDLTGGAGDQTAALHPSYSPAHTWNHRIGTSEGASRAI